MYLLKQKYEVLEKERSKQIDADIINITTGYIRNTRRRINKFRNKKIGSQAMYKRKYLGNNET